MLWVESTPDNVAGLDWLAEKNEQDRLAGRKPRIGGTILRLGAGEIMRGYRPEECTVTVPMMMAKACAVRALKTTLLVSLKSWHYQGNDAANPYPIVRYRPVVPDDTGPVMTMAGDLLVEDHRYIVQKNTPSGPCRVYSARPWMADEEAWIRRMYIALAGQMVGNSGFAGVLTTESSPILGAGAALSSTGYPGAQEYGAMRLRTLMLLRESLPNHAVVDNHNWLPTDTDAVHAWYADQVNTIGASLFLQDLNKGAMYVRYCYPYMKCVPKERRWGQITNDTQMNVSQALDLAEGLDIGHLAFLQFDKGEIETALEREDACYGA